MKKHKPVKFYLMEHLERQLWREIHFALRDHLRASLRHYHTVWHIKSEVWLRLAGRD